MKWLGDRPRWVKIALVLMFLSGIIVPLTIGKTPGEMAVFVLLYPVFAWIGTYLCWRLYPTERNDLFWVLFILVWASFGLLMLPTLL